ncbi:MAG: hypothetical protein AAFR00_12665 [Pseudomonadota bacterium]
MTRPHPLDDPLLAPAWPMLAALIEALAVLIAPCAPDGAPVFLRLRQRIRSALRHIEHTLRRALLLAADAAVSALPPLRPSPAITDTSVPPAKAKADSQALPRFRLHETPPSAHRDRAAKPRPTPSDPYGLLQLPTHREWTRYVALVMTVENPSNAIRRLARILRRRRGDPSVATAKRARRALPFNPDTPPARIRDLSDPPPVPVPISIHAEPNPSSAPPKGVNP